MIVCLSRSKEGDVNITSRLQIVIYRNQQQSCHVMKDTILCRDLREIYKSFIIPNIGF